MSCVSRMLRRRGTVNEAGSKPGARWNRSSSSMMRKIRIDRAISSAVSLSESPVNCQRKKDHACESTTFQLARRLDSGRCMADVAGIRLEI